MPSRWTKPQHNGTRGGTPATYNDIMTAARLPAPAGQFATDAGYRADAPAPTDAPVIGRHANLVTSLANRINARTGAPLKQLLDAGTRRLAKAMDGSIAAALRRAMFDSIRQGGPGTPPHQLQRGVDAYRATLETMADIEAGQGNDDEQFRRLAADVATAARGNPVAGRLKHIVATIIAGFPAREQIILQLSLVDDCSIAEIASILDMNRDSAARIRRTAIGQLRHQLACLPAS